MSSSRASVMGRAVSLDVLRMVLADNGITDVEPEPVMALRVIDEDEEVIAAVCTEGVGWLPFEELDGYLIPILVGTPYSSHTVTILYSQFLEAVVDSEPVDLAEWVRVFGARLESNFGLWNRMSVEWKPLDLTPRYGVGSYL